MKLTVDDYLVELDDEHEKNVLCDDESSLSTASSLGLVSGEATPGTDIQHQKALQDFFARHDTISSAKQAVETLKALLTDLAGGTPTSDEEVHTILEEAYGVAIYGTGVIESQDMPNHAQVTSDMGHVVPEAGYSAQKEAGQSNLEV